MNFLAMPPRTRLFAWTALLVLTIGGSLFLQNVDRVEESQWVGYKGEARRNRLLALQRLLERHQVPVKSLSNLSELPPSGATLFLPTERLSLSAARSDALRRWVESGGNLIVVTWTIKGEAGVDALLDPLGVEQKVNAIEDGADWERLLDPKRQLARVDIGADVLRVHFDPRYRLDPLPPNLTMRVASDRGVHAIRMPLGKGMLTVMTDAEFADNDNIGVNDHAAFAWHLLQPSTGREVWLVRAEDMPALWQLAWEHAPALVTTMALLLAVFLWSRMPRFGPRLPAPALARRQLGEHIIASGWYLWRNRRGGRLLEALRTPVLARVPELASVGNGSDDTPAQAVAAPIAGVPLPAIRRAMAATGEEGEQTFVEAVKTLETIRKLA